MTGVGQAVRPQPVAPNPPMRKPLRVGVIGMGGFAGVHHDTLLALERQGLCKLLCTCDPEPGSFLEQMSGWDFIPREVKVFDDYRDMLDACAGELDLVTIPTPVPLHAEMHRACVERGIAVYLEKPPTLDVNELNEMLAVEATARWQTNVGFNYIVEAPRQELKRRMLRGEFGRLRSVECFGLWPREQSYYRRANWAGRLTLNGKLVLDSPLGNAMAHYAHNVLFWAGQKELFDWSPVERVRAGLYRAHAIQGTDTVFVDAVTDAGVALRLALTHACAGQSRHWERVVCDDATITYVTNEYYELHRGNGEVETRAVPAVTLRENLEAHFAYLTGEGLDRPVTRLADCRPFVELNDLAYLAAGTITTVYPPYVTMTHSTDGREEYVSIQGIEGAFDRFFDNGQFPSEQGLTWARVGETATRADLPSLRETVMAMAAQAPSTS